MLKKLTVVLLMICLIVILPILIFTVPFAQAQPGENIESPPQIVGGEEANPIAWPWQVALVSAGSTDFYDDLFCAGSLVEKNWVVTAAHCVEELSPDDFEVVVGVHDLSNPEAGYQKIAVQDIIFYPDYMSGSYDSDIALLQLAAAADVGETSGGTAVAPITLVPADSGDLAGLQSTLTGWGNTLAQPVPGGVNDPQTLQQVELPILTKAACESAYDDNVSPGDWISDNMLCVGLEFGGKGACQGDDGGPLVIFDDALQAWQLAGVISWSEGCAAPGIPGVNTRVSQFTDWVHSYILQADVSLEKTGSAAAISPGQTMAYTMTLKNMGGASANGITLTDTIPISTTYIADSATGGGIYADGNVVWSDLSVAAGGEAAVSFSVQIDDNKPVSALSFFDDMEDGDDNWIVDHDPSGAAVNWQLDDSYPNSGAMAWFGENVGTVSDQYLVLPLVEPLAADSSLNFWHAYDLEDPYDGGVVEISINNGASWIDLGAAMTENGYNGQLDLSDNPLAEREAFTGDSDGYIKTSVDLSAYAAETVQIRFRLGTDDFVSALGWFVDDISIGTYSTIENSAYTAELESNLVSTQVVDASAADLELTKIVSAAEIMPGQTVVYTLTLQNKSELAAAGITLTDTIPISTTYVADSATNGGVFADNMLIWPDLAVAENSEIGMSFAVQVDETAVPTQFAFFDDMENGVGDWMVSHDTNGGAVDWILDDANPYSGVTAWFGENVDAVSDLYLVLPLSDTLEANSSLRFWHSYDLEEMVDGGVVEISTDDGENWIDLGSVMTLNGYNHLLEPSDNPLADRFAFTGNSGEYLETAVDLNAYTGEIVQIRFRLGTNASLAANGWHIDDVFVGVFSAVDNIAKGGDLISNTARTYIIAAPEETGYSNYLPIVMTP